MKNGIFNDALVINQTVRRDFIGKEEPTAVLPPPNERGEIIQRLHFTRDDRLEKITYHSKETK